MYRTRFTHAVAFILAAITLTACASIVAALFGESTEPDANDTSPPRVTLYSSDTYFSRPEGAIQVGADDLDAYAEDRYVSFSAIAEDSGGVRYVEIEEIVIQPLCRQLTGGGRAPAVPQTVNGNPYTIRSVRVETPADAESVTTRIPVFQSILVPAFGEASERCNDTPLYEAPLFVGAIAEVRATGGNFGTGTPANTGLFRIAFGTARFPSRGGGVFPPPRGGGSPGGGDSCDGEGDACMVTPDQCFARDDFSVQGTIVCRNGAPRCEARSGEDYCEIAGTAACGGAVGALCSTDSDCGLFSVCDRNNRCASLTIPEPSTGNVPCTPVNGACWLPEETGNAAVRAGLCNQ